MESRNSVTLKQCKQTRIQKDKHTPRHITVKFLNTKQNKTKIKDILKETKEKRNVAHKRAKIRLTADF